MLMLLIVAKWCMCMHCGVVLGNGVDSDHPREVFGVKTVEIPFEVDIYPIDMDR